MTSRYIAAVVAGTMLVAGALATAQTGGTAVAQAFEHYEAIRVALAADKLDGVATHAEALAPLAMQVAGKAARTAAEQLRGAKALDKAREHFGTLSEALVPKFLEARLPGVHGFTCSMKNKPWVQRTDKVQNPYYGQGMLTCGVALKAAS